MTPREYELYVSDQYRQREYEVEPQRGVGDWGVDLFAVKGPDKAAIQVKMYGDTARPVNRAMVMELEGARRYFDCTSAAIVTNGRVLPDAQKVADKLGIPIHILQIAQGTGPSTPPEGLHFDQIWVESIMPLAGKSLKSKRGENKIVRVDWSGVERISSSGKPSFIPIEAFRNAVRRLLESGVISRDEINDLHVGRASSGICLILAQVPVFRYGGRPASLRYQIAAGSDPRPILSQSEPILDESENVPSGELFRHTRQESTMNRLPPPNVVSDAQSTLAPPGRTLDDPDLTAKDGPGLYAIYGSPEVWVQLGLGPPPDDRPLYIGKAEESVIARDVHQHFRTGSTGSSTVRRSLAAFLRGPLELKAQPRNTAKPDHFSSYSIQSDGDKRLTEWMRGNLRLALWIRPTDDDLRPLESRLLQHWQPPLNGQGVKTPWSARLSAARKSMADEARAWTKA